ncbi:GDP-L-fucose synthase [Aliidongia dinghuensis]|uniref:GDP-L-fucose synthase n=1 Tax=Aliidongia dinghuensis TaxID=1867774 RepID=A0A8J2YW94_9PROT|nr:NAD-dependent epimerase/dehydratase family protein [Aliidongia dinghuensis]GGF24000.1 GDP-L-fucose synthase [Aliidongia dinghuensis]
MFAGRKILVAGASGFLGGALTRRLVELGALVRGCHLSRAPDYHHANLEWLRVDLEDEQACASACVGADYVLMCAANTSGAAAITSTPLVHVTPNVIMNARMLEAAHHAGVERFLFISSGAAYPDLGEDHPLREDEMFRGDPPPVYYPVGWMKRYTEILCRIYAERIADRPMTTIVVRPSNVYGPGDKWDFARSHVTAAQIRRVIERHAPIVVWGDGTDVRDLIYIDDFVEGALRALAIDRRHFVVNIASGRGYSIHEIVQTAIRADEYVGAEIHFDPSKPRTIGKRLFDVSLARNLLGFKSQVPIEDGFRRTIDAFRAAHGTPRPAR